MSLADFADAVISAPFILGIVIGLVIGYLAGTQRGRKPARPAAKPNQRPKQQQPPRRAAASSAASGGSSGDCVEIYVGNLSYETSEDQLRKEFERFGKVKSARIISNRFSRKSKGFGFIEMPVRSEAEAAIKALHDKDIQGRKLRVNEARNKTHE